MWRAVSFVISQRASTEVGSGVGRQGIRLRRGLSISRSLNEAELRVADVSAVLDVLLPGAEVSATRDSSMNEVSVVILEATDRDRTLAEQMAQMTLVVPIELTSAIRSEVFFVSPPQVVSVAVSAPPPPPRPPIAPHPSAPLAQHAGENSTSDSLPTLPESTGASQALTDLNDGTSSALHIIVIIAVVAVLAVLLIVLTVIYCLRRRRLALTAKDICDAHTIEVRVDRFSSPPQRISIAEPLAEALASKKDDVPMALQRIRSLRMRSVPSVTSASIDAPSEDTLAIGADVELELDMEFDILRKNMARRASAAQNQPRLEQRRLQVQRADALLMAWQNRERSVTSMKLVHDLPVGHELRTFDPDSFANRALVAQQASVLAQAARRNARMRLCASDDECISSPLRTATLDPITGTIRRASLTGGRFHARDLASQFSRTEAEHDGEADPDKWFLSAMTVSSREVPDTFASPEFQGRLGRAREARRTGEGGRQLELAAPGTPCASASQRVDSTTQGEKTPSRGSASKPRSLAEIRSASPRRCQSCTPGSLATAALDPLTNALHTASMLGIEPPPPPDQWRSDEVDVVALARDAPERVRRARTDREARMGRLSKEDQSPAHTSATRGDHKIGVAQQQECRGRSFDVITKGAATTPPPRALKQELCLTDGGMAGRGTPSPSTTGSRDSNSAQDTQDSSLGGSPIEVGPFPSPTSSDRLTRGVDKWGLD